MHIPRFSAETALYKSQGSYATLQHVLTPSGGKKISGIIASMDRIQLAPVAPPGDGVPPCGIAFGLCVLICDAIGETHCLTRCYKEFCGPGPVIVAHKSD